MTDDIQETFEQAKTRAAKRIQSLYANGKSGISFNFKTGTERHQVAIDRLTHLIQYHPYLKENGMGDELCSDVYISSVLQTSGDFARFQKLDNIKKWQYRFDVYSYKSRTATVLENECKISKTGSIHYLRKIIEINGGYHDKWKQMMKDEWRDIDSLQIFPAAQIIRFHVDELVPENLNPDNDFCSIDFDVIRKILTGRNYFSKSTTDLDMVGRPVGRNMLMPKNYFS